LETTDARPGHGDVTGFVVPASVSKAQVLSHPVLGAWYGSHPGMFIWGRIRGGGDAAGVPPVGVGAAVGEAEAEAGLAGLAEEVGGWFARAGELAEGDEVVGQELAVLGDVVPVELAAELVVARNRVLAAGGSVVGGVVVPQMPQGLSGVEL